MLLTGCRREDKKSDWWIDRPLVKIKEQIVEHMIIYELFCVLWIPINPTNLTAPRLTVSCKISNGYYSA